MKREPMPVTVPPQEGGAKPYAPYVICGGCGGRVLVNSAGCETCAEAPEQAAPVLETKE